MAKNPKYSGNNNDTIRNKCNRNCGHFLPYDTAISCVFIQENENMCPQKDI